MKEDKPTIIMSDTDYCKLYKIFEKTPATEYFETVMDCIKVVPDADIEKRLWKARILDTPKNKDSICFFQKEYYTDVREMSVKEAVEWYKDLKEHLNDFESVYDSDARGLFYKKDGEWVRYNFHKEK